MSTLIVALLSVTLLTGLCTIVSDKPGTCLGHSFFWYDRFLEQEAVKPLETEDKISPEPEVDVIHQSSVDLESFTGTIRRLHNVTVE